MKLIVLTKEQINTITNAVALYEQANVPEETTKKLLSANTIKELIRANTLCYIHDNAIRNDFYDDAIDAIDDLIDELRNVNKLGVKL